MSAVAVLSIPDIMTTIPLSMTLCAICCSADLVIPCLACHRPQCEECFSREDDLLRTCKACRMEKELEMDKESVKWNPMLDVDTDDEEEEEVDFPDDIPQWRDSAPPPPSFRPHLGYMVHPSHPLAHPVEYIERGLLPFDGILYPTQEEWKHAENILFSHIQFTSGHNGYYVPHLDKRYLIGQMIHRFPNLSTVTTDYMLAYEEDLANPGHYLWRKYMATYYNKSPLPYDQNIFFPWPLPLAFHS